MEEAATWILQSGETMGLRMICKTCRTENQNVENGNLYEKKREVDYCNIQSKG